MYIRQEDRDAYNNVYRAEILLRRMLRWELRGVDGPTWYNELGPTADEAETRMATDRGRKRLYPGYTIFSYLTLTELLNLIFRDLWKGRFQHVFANRKSLRHSEFDNLIAVRNKIGHFRAVGHEDIKDLAAIALIQADILEHHQYKADAGAYVPGAFEYAEQQIDIDVTEPLVAALKKHDRSELWDVFLRFNEYRADGLSPGIGFIHHHVFLEFYTRGSFSGKHLLKFSELNENEITFLNVGANAHFVRIFVPLVFPFSTIKKTAKKFAVACRSDNSVKEVDRATTISRFQIGFRDSVQGDAINTYTGFIF